MDSKKVKVKLVIGDREGGTTFRYLPQVFTLEASIQQEGDMFTAFFQGTEGAIEGGGDSEQEALDDLVEAFEVTVESLMETGDLHAAMEAYGYRCATLIEPVRQRTEDEYTVFFGKWGASWQLLPPPTLLAQR